MHLQLCIVTNKLCIVNKQKSLFFRTSTLALFSLFFSNTLQQGWCRGIFSQINSSPFKLSPNHRVVNKNNGHNSSRDYWWLEHQSKASFSLAGALIVNTHKFLQSSFPFPCSGVQEECYHFLHFDCSKLKLVKEKWNEPAL